MDQNNPANPVDTPIPSEVPSEVKITPPKRIDLKLIAIGLTTVAVLIGVGVFVIQPWSERSKAKTQTIPTPIKKSESGKMFLTVSNPNQNSLIIDNETLVKGKTLPGSTVMIYTSIDDETAESDSEGNFETTISLAEGEEVLSITAVSQVGEEKTLDFELNVKPQEI
ncbi:hypothetical protein MUP32_01905 [Candidatus Microgenomates bacterium]|nr:hypothetical protein [Candidatus Microgenomates bacterium]